jgi:hypothetical protein
MPTLKPERWFDAVIADDLRLHNVAPQAGETPPQTIQRLAAEIDVDLANVGCCLALLRTGRCLLSGGAPLALLAYSPQHEVYRASFDGACDADLSALSAASAGVWLVLLASEIGELPDHDQHWLMARLTDTGVVARNPYVQGLAQGYANQSILPATEPSASHGEYELLMGRAFWWCASHCLS